MKRIALCVSAALVAALAAGMMAGCSSQSASSASKSASTSASAAASSKSASASASAASEQSQDKIVAEFKDALKNAPKFKSVTVTEDSLATLSGNAEAKEANTESNSIATRTVYKFDESGDKVRTSMVCEIEDVKLQYITEGDNAVCVTDGPVYSGTVEQFDLSHAAGFEAYFKRATGDMDTIIGCVATATKSQQDGMTVYQLTLDPQKRIASDEIFQIMADSGDPVLSESVIIGFDEKGNLVWANEKREFKASTAENNIMISDFDSTVVDPMPEADKTFEEMEADIDEKYEELFAELEKAESAEGAVSSEAAAAK